MNLQTVKNQKGFTIVELLIVIVVIGILAAITIVAFNGIQNRANQTSAESVANSVAKKLEAWNSVVGSYPTYCQFARNETNATGTATGLGTAGCTAATTPTAGPVEAKLDDPNSISATTGPITSATGKNVVQVVPNGTLGARINFWRYTASAPGLSSDTTTPKSPTVGTP